MAEFTSSSTSSSTCHCIDLCCCAEGEFEGEFGEGSCRPSTEISWQHFPPSTSSPSRCDDSSAEPESPSLPESCKTESVEKEASEEKVTYPESPITKSLAQLDAEHYLTIRNIFQLFNFLIGHLVCAEPEDPIQYLKEILDRCLLWRDGYGEEPLLVSKYHIKSLYDTFDPYGKGSITIEQYQEAMDNVGITKGVIQYNMCPPLNEDGRIDEEFFLNEMYSCCLENMKMMLRVPNGWEENRLIWKRKAERRRRKELQRCERDIPCLVRTEDEEAHEDSNSETNNPKRPGPCQHRKMRHEPVQLFLPV
ncbi:UNVERIFIED_CONTAM: hypothetical protein PYX00_000349 [Menopon gallinae]|uniref:EF-hand domain-containing protein n=1 Tax=Menopon gallinae TaxID=328185 RepID=A0AAW2I871_9NEOP